MLLRAFVLLLGIALLDGCVQVAPEDAMVPAADALSLRQLQTRRFSGISEEKLLAASAGVIQDMGFNIEESETKLGVITGSKQRSGVQAWQLEQRMYQAMLGQPHPDSTVQRFRISVVVRPVSRKKKEDQQIRVTFQRLVWRFKDHTIFEAESLKEPGMYQEFFDKLSKSVFLEAQEVQ